MKKSVENGSKKIFAGTKALVMGLGLHGGGVATTKWLLRHGAKVTATDKRTKEVLAPSLRALKAAPATFILGEHRKKDFEQNDLIVVNPGVPRESEYLAVATKAGKRIENDASLFFRFSSNPVIAVTGTRGKTTTTLWIAELMKKKYPQVLPSGNTPDNAFLKEFERVKGKNIPVVAEMSSWQLEYLPVSGRAPRVAVITNLYPDHLNRYDGIKGYADAKANIFHDQHADDVLILNHENEWTTYFLKKRPKSLTFFISTRSLTKPLNGLFVRGEHLMFRFDGIEQKLFSIKRFINERGRHNLENLLCAVLAIKLFDPEVMVAEKDALRLPTPRMRQEVVMKKGRLTVVNDSCATSPDGVEAALTRFGKEGNIILVTGGTDKELEFASLAKKIKKFIPREQLVLLEGSATKKLIAELVKQKYFKGHAQEIHATLASCVDSACAIAETIKGKPTILFSPGAASFEKFLHEFDRGEKFNHLIKKFFLGK